jgi:quaternary ammonium compound-resistance protein SugE
LSGSNKVVINTPVFVDEAVDILSDQPDFCWDRLSFVKMPHAAGLAWARCYTCRPCFAESWMSWICLFVAGLLEVAWAVGLKYTAGFTRLLPSAFTLVAMAGSVGMLGLALRTLPLGTAYAVWTGIGTVGTAIAGMLLLGEPAGALRLLSIGLIVAGIVGLKLLTPA